jgi:hypothetical protein
MSNSEAVIQTKLKISLLLGTAWFTNSDLHLAPENDTIIQIWAVLLHARELSGKHSGLPGLPPPHTKRPKSVQYVHITMPCLRRTHLKEAAHKMIPRYKFNKTFTIRYPDRINEKAGFSPTLIRTSSGM